MTPKNSVIAAACLVLSLTSFSHAEWAIKPAPIMTRFAASVTPANVLPEYPRPQMTRTDWLNLNGLWEFQPGQENDPLPVGKTLGGQILVPFPVESALSGVMERHDRLWYRRAFTVPTAWAGRRVMLHFGAVDYEAEVFVNGKRVGGHAGGYVPFALDVTDALNGDGPQELIVRVYDPTDKGGFPRGKQTLRPGGAMYSTVTGIWQTVWLEPVAAGGIDALTIVPDVDAGQVKVTANVIGGAKGTPVVIAVMDGEQTVARARGAAGEAIGLAIPDAKLWSPDTPHLYDLTVSLVGADDRPTDTVGSYFGMRKVTVGDVDGVKRLLLNGKFVFQHGPLDQGFWPDGIYTPPSDDAMRYDVQATKDMGFNLIRKHLKVEPARWYYWADRIGLLVWQDMPSPNSYLDKAPPVDKPAFERELTEMVLALRNVPSIVMWVPFNESQGQHDTGRYVDLIKRLDPTRLVNEGSGGGHTGAGDVFDIHVYPSPLAPPANKTMALACGEYGGIALKVPGHMWREGQGGGYLPATSPIDLLDKYSEVTNKLKDLRDNHGLSAAIYTQTTDVETEINGLLTYDRVPKVDLALIAKANRFEFPMPTYRVIVPTSQHERQTWRYTTQRPDGDKWTAPGFDDSAWQQGPGGFGMEPFRGTEWRSDDLWMRRTFRLPKLTAAELENLPLSVFHDDDAEVYVNGVLAYRGTGHNGHYENVRMTDEARKSLVVDGENTLAVHCNQKGGGQFIDVGFVQRISAVRAEK